MMHVSAAQLDTAANLAHVGDQPARPDMADHAGRGYVVEDTVILAVVALMEFPARRTCHRSTTCRRGPGTGGGLPGECRSEPSR